MTFTDFLSAAAQLAVVIFMLMMLAWRKQLTTLPTTRPVKVRVPNRDELDPRGHDVLSD